MTDIKPAPPILHALRTVPVASQGLNDDDAEMRRRIGMQAAEKYPNAIRTVDDLLAFTEWIEKGYTTEDDS